MNLIQIINMAEPKPAARGMLEKQLSWQAMYQRTKKALDNMFINIQNMDTNMQNMRIERDHALAQVKRLQQRNLQLWDTYVARGAQNAQEASVGVAAQSSAISSTVQPVGGNGEAVEDCSVADERITTLLSKIDAIAGDYGSWSFGLPLHAPEVKQQMVACVQTWLTPECVKGGE